ncbi:pilus assembly protein [Kitasatospora sp. MAP5-34]|uniref:TadE family protein n=1 Tax=Kitasatospora sp. MAP5-34 TaxID=3035102 RepID=UPI002475FE7C|nr:pilus assembly protein [Kitasatospora sp. MAP5-34]MDH6575161.1 hypothetical protein [Kitasatospora sp. MAP5-34]
MTISLAIVFPAVLTIVLLVVQAALWWYASEVALTAAREGADAGRIMGGTQAAADQRVTDFLGRFGSLARPAGTDMGGTDGTTFHISVTVKPLNVLPMLTMPDVTRYVDAPREKFVPQGGQP